MRLSAVILSGLMVCLAAPELSAAERVATGSRTAIDIPAQNLESALQLLSKQRDLQVIYRSEVVGQLRTNGASGVFTPLEALRELLSGTGLTFRHLNDTTVTIVPVSVSFEGDAAVGVKPIAAVGDDVPLRLAQAETAPVSQRVAQVKDTPADEREQNRSNQREEEVVVTGSRLNRSATEGPQPVLQFDRNTIQRSGQTSIAEFLRSLPEASGSSYVEAPNGAYPHAATVQLRGLPPGRTLTLINGRRMPATANTDGGFANLNSIPAAAVERIDVLPQGASAIYGSDALAGVINIVLRREHDGISAETRFGATDGQSDRRVSAVWGSASERGAFSVIADYYDRTTLNKNERDITRDADYTRFGWRDLRGTACNPGTVYSTTTANLPGLNSTSAAIPAGLTGVPTIANFVATAGQVNRCGNSGNNYGLIYPAHRYSVLTTGDLDIGNVTVFGEASYSRLHHEFYYPYTLSRVLVPANNPYNPFGVPVRVDYAFPANVRPDAVSDVDNRFVRALGGVRGKISGDWQWETSAWGAKDTSNTAFRVPSSAFAAPELSSSDPQTAMNLFGTGGAPLSQSVLDSYTYSGPVSAITREGSITTTGLNGLLRGSLFRLPAGDLSVAFGGEYVKEQYENTGQRGEFDIGRNSKALYTELRAPLLLRADKQELLTLSAALRRDDYSDFGVATTPQYGVELRPTSSLLIRASYADAFRAPDLFAVHGPALTGVGITVIDPRRNNETVAGLAYIAGGNADLVPEEGNSISAGIVWSSARFSGFTATVNWWRIDMTDRISLFPSTQLIVNNEALFPGRVTRGPDPGNGLPGPITGLNYSALNLGDIWVEGVDLGLEYRFETSLGSWTPSVRATRYTRYDALLNPQVGMSDYLGNANSDIWVPRWRGTAGLGWRLNAVSAGLTGRYVGHYRDYNPLNSGVYQQLGDFWIWDANARWNIGASLSSAKSWLASSYIALGAVNVFDRPVQFSAATTPGYGYDPSQGDIRGRYGYLEVGLKF